VQAMHDEGGILLCQLWHAGRWSHWSHTCKASGAVFLNSKVGRPISENHPIHAQ
jgi:2,4-dienoyl-CoA reductase-like NADH-dependent reductase (Old Yellow Enzyme family)